MTRNQQKSSKFPTSARRQLAALERAVARLKVERPRSGGRARGALPPPARSPAEGAHADKYAMALLHPFSQAAEGVRVPEPYAQPTVTYRFRRVVELTTSSSGSIDFAIFPQLGFLAAQYQGSASGIPAGTITNGPAGVTVYTSGAQVGTMLRQYRVVAFGARLKSNTTFANTTGRVYAARIPSARDFPGAAVPAGTTLTEFSDMMSVPIDGTGITSSINALPGSVQYTLSELHQESGTEFTTHPVSPAAIDFLDGLLQQKESQSGVAVNYQAGFYSGNGWQSILIAGNGLPASSQVLTLELVYHVEGIPLVTSTTGGAMIPSGMVAAVGSHSALAAIHSQVSQMPFAVKLREKAQQEAKARVVGAFRKIGREALKAARSNVERGGLAADLLGVAV